MIKRTVIGTLICLFSAGAALADRPPNAQERSSIEAALKAAGFNVWEEIENDDGKWEVDDAVHADGHTYDLELDLTSYAIVKKERDD